MRAPSRLTADVLTRLLVLAAVELAALACLTWAVSLWLEDASVADVVWGPAFAVVAWTGVTAGEGDATRSVLLAGLVTVWAVRLSAHLAARRRRAGGEDDRYADMRRRAGDAFRWRSLFTVFLFQAAAAWVVAFPIAVTGASGRPLGLDAVVVALWLGGFVVEAVADEQLRRFKRDVADRAAVLDRGLWGVSRHPNYFGEIVMWWAIGLLAVPSRTGVWALLGPVFLTFLIVRVSGKRHLERRMASRPAYRSYVSRTAGLVPRPVRRLSR